MEQKEWNNLKCVDIVQCTNHPKVKGRSVDLMGGDWDNETHCGCHTKDFKIIVGNTNNEDKQ